jgi:hypothetical protein
MIPESLAASSILICAPAARQVFLWSSLPNAERASGGKWQVAHFSDKAKVSKHGAQPQGHAARPALWHSSV